MLHVLNIATRGERAVDESDVDVDTDDLMTARVGDVQRSIVEEDRPR